eukprot:jgi/Mesvir1/3072/Mv12054-RA.1
MAAKKWECVYTPQKKQKTKKWHDGLLLVKEAGARYHVQLLDPTKEPPEVESMTTKHLVEVDSMLDFERHLCQAMALVGDISASQKPAQADGPAQAKSTISAPLTTQGPGKPNFESGPRKRAHFMAPAKMAPTFHQPDAPGLPFHSRFNGQMNGCFPPQPWMLQREVRGFAADPSYRDPYPEEIEYGRDMPMPAPTSHMDIQLFGDVPSFGDVEPCGNQPSDEPAPLRSRPACDAPKRNPRNRSVDDIISILGGNHRKPFQPPRAATAPLPTATSLGNPPRASQPQHEQAPAVVPGAQPQLRSLHGAAWSGHNGFMALAAGRSTPQHDPMPVSGVEDIVAVRDEDEEDMDRENRVPGMPSSHLMGERARVSSATAPSVGRALASLATAPNGVDAPARGREAFKAPQVVGAWAGTGSGDGNGGFEHAHRSVVIPDTFRDVTGYAGSFLGAMEEELALVVAGVLAGAARAKRPPESAELILKKKQPWFGANFKRKRGSDEDGDDGDGDGGGRSKQQEKSYFLKLPHRGKPSSYSKGDLWIISSKPDFQRPATRNDFVCCVMSTFHGPDRDGMLKEGAADVTAPKEPTLSAVKQSIIESCRLNADQVTVLEQGERWLSDLGGPGGAGALRNPLSFTRASSPICLVHGAFGSGKSHLLVAVVLFMAQVLKEWKDSETRILISAATNVAVDRPCLLS